MSFRFSSQFFYLFLLNLILLINLFPLNINGGGMTPISEVKDETPTPTIKSSSSSSEDKKKEFTKDDKIKTAAHVKIAKTHIEQEEGNKIFISDNDNEDFDDNTRLFRKDKLKELQNPAKHASDEWLLNFLIEQYTITQKIEDQIEILQNLEHFSHKFENGRDLFQATNALTKVLLPSLNSSNIEIKKAACGVFAIASQNNEIVQKIAQESGAIRSLVHLLTFDNHSVKERSLIALSSLLRNYPQAQRKFIHDGGIAALINIAYLPETRKRCISFVIDLLNERKYCREDESLSSSFLDSGDDPCDKEDVLDKALKQNNWCEVLKDSVKNIVGFGFDDQLTIIEALQESIEMCGEDIKPLVQVFQKLLKKEKEANILDNIEDDEDEYSQNDNDILIARIEDILKSTTLKSKNNFANKDEL